VSQPAPGRLGIVVTHPIQYYTPLFARLAERLDVHVFYGFVPDAAQRGAAGFGHAIDWGLDLLRGHPHSICSNRARRPDTDAFSGIDTPDIGRDLRREGITHVLVLGWQSRMYWQAKLAALRARLPLAVRGDSCLDARTPLPRHLAKRLAYPLFLRCYTRLFYVGQRNRAYLLAHGAPRSRLAFFPHAVDQQFWTPAPRRPHDGSVRFLWVGKLIDIKRPLDMVEAFRRAHAADPSLRLDMVGSGPLEPGVRAAAGAHPAIRLLGFRDQPALRESYRDAHCLVSTSTRETWGLVANEALACGLPVIASNGVGSVDDLVAGRNTGIVYPVGDVATLARTLASVAALLRHAPGHFGEAIAGTNAIYHFDRGVAALDEFLRLPSRHRAAGARPAIGEPAGTA
jgi:glycosyltransferase involved in cell wall biosynthesis